MKSSLSTPSQGFVKEDSSILSPRLRIGITVVSALTVLLALWSLLARIPIIVNAAGVLIPSRGLFTASSPSEGVVVYPFLDVNGKPTYTPPTWSSLAYDYQWGISSEGGETTDTITLARLITDDISADEWIRFSAKNVNDSTVKATVPFKSVVAIVDNSAARSRLLLALAEYDSKKAQNDAMMQKLVGDIKSASAMAKSNEQIYLNSKPLVPDAMATVQLLEKEQSWLRQLERLRGLEQQKIQESEQLNQALDNLNQSLQVYLNKSMVYAWEDAYLSTISEEQWANVIPGNNLLTLTWKDEISPNVIPIFLDANTYAQASKGMEVIVTPDGFSPSEIGGIKGHIVNISPLPKDRKELANMLGISAASDASFSSVQGTVYLAEVKLETTPKYSKSTTTLFHNLPDNLANNSGGYLWNNQANPPLPPRTGQKVGVQITTRYQSPASMVLSFLKEAVGFEVPEKFRSSN